MPPSKSLVCSFEDCNRVFTKASDLKKHEVSHVNPEKVFKCSVCDFDSLQKKNLRIHMARHTGEKPLLCPHTVIWLDSSDSEWSVIEQECSFRTNDPAALTRHRKAHHGYVPKGRGPVQDGPSVPSIPTGVTVPKRVPSLPTGVTVPKATEATQRRVSFLVPMDVNDSDSDSGYSTPEPPHSPAMPWSRHVEAYGGETGDAESSDTVVIFPSISRFLTMSSQDHAIALQKPMDPPFSFEWESPYVEDNSESYMVEVERLREDLDTELHEEDIFNLKTGREGCLCPKWMVEANIDGWDDSVLELHKDYYAPLASA